MSKGAAAVRSQKGAISASLPRAKAMSRSMIITLLERCKGVECKSVTGSIGASNPDKLALIRNRRPWQEQGEDIIEIL
jgi:hypothetical protein